MRTITIRPAEWPRDERAIAALDASFESDWTFAVVAGPLSFAVVERAADPPISKRYAVPMEDLRAARTVVAEEGGRVVGVAAITAEPWNRRAVLVHLYVDRPARECGVGLALLQWARHAARTAGARCLWAETQDVNAPAIRFYLHHGFVWCGLDTTLYDPREVAGETALFFAYGLEES